MIRVAHFWREMLLSAANSQSLNGWRSMETTCRQFGISMTVLQLICMLRHVYQSLQRLSSHSLSPFLVFFQRVVRERGEKEEKTIKRSEQHGPRSA